MNSITSTPVVTQVTRNGFLSDQSVNQVSQMYSVQSSENHLSNLNKLLESTRQSDLKATKSYQTIIETCFPEPTLKKIKIEKFSIHESGIGDYVFTPLLIAKTQTADSSPSRAYNDKITTQLPRMIVLIRLVAVTAFTGLLALTAGSTLLMWTFVMAGSAFAGWTIYSQLMRKDPLVEAFYKISGGKDQYEALQEISLNSAKTVSENLLEINDDSLKHPYQRAITKDGRKILILKTEEKVCAFVEKLGPYDLPSTFSSLSPKNSRFLESTLYALAFWKNTNCFTNSIPKTIEGKNLDRFIESSI